MDQDKQSDLSPVKKQQETAVDLIRTKLDKLYGPAPKPVQEPTEATSHMHQDESKHQRFMKGLSNSGRGLAEIQTAWHDYYKNLPDNEKHEVWQEFYSRHEMSKQVAPAQPATILSNNTATLQRSRPKQSDSTARDIKDHLLSQIQNRSAVTQNHHVRSLAFGLSMGLVTLFILMFGFFNERIVTPFIRPNSSVSATPIIVDPNVTSPVGPESKIIIPKINVEAPVVYDLPSIEENVVQKGLENGVVHYATTPKPGEKGNAVIFGHSSSNILNKGKYKFAFLLLKSLEKEDTFIVQKDGKRYVYKVYNKFVTHPTDFSVLSATDKPATITLITCDPPGTSTNRLIIQAEQIFPDPGANNTSSIQQTPQTQAKREQLPSNSVSLWSRITGGL